jgi:retron-type reverse transcriptase
MTFERELLADLIVAYYDARKNKRHTANQLKFEFYDLEFNLYGLWREICQREYKISPSIAFVIEKPTKREIFAATFRDRVVHHLVYNYIAKWWSKQFIYDSYSCQIGKGTHFGIKRIDHFMRRASGNYARPAWVLKLDISGYFMHMNRDLLWQFCQKGLVKQPDLVDWQRELLAYLLPIIIFNDPTKGVIIKGKLSDWADLPRSKSLFAAPANCGFPIGNLTSQLFSNIYLHQLDCFAQYNLGLKNYGRYVDDFIIVDKTKAKLKVLVGKIRRFLKKELMLTLHPHKVYLQPVKHGVGFLGAKIKPYRVLPGQRLVKNYLQLLREERGHNFEERKQSYWGHLGNFPVLALA